MKRNPELSETKIRGVLALTLAIPPRPEEANATGGPRRPDLMAEGRRRVLLHLWDHGTASVADMPRAWPLSQFLLRAAAAQLIARGLVESIAEPEGNGRGRLQLTETGKREIEASGLGEQPSS